jgi:hypothetical protein
LWGLVGYFGYERHVLDTTNIARVMPSEVARIVLTLGRPRGAAGIQDVDKSRDKLDSLTRVRKRSL